LTMQSAETPEDDGESSEEFVLEAEEP
jgi:hypothetical protein